MPYADPAKKKEVDRAYGNANREQRKTRGLAWRKENPERYRWLQWKHTLKSKFGLSPEDYERLLQEQGGMCAICGTRDTRPWDHLTVDHDHSCCVGPGSCGSCIRGLLCHHCNACLGHAQDDPQRLRRAILYLGGAP